MAPGPEPIDTDPEVFMRLVDRWRSMSIDERAALTNQLCLGVEALAIAGIRLDQPEIDPDDLRYELARRRYGRDLADAAYAK